MRTALMIVAMSAVLGCKKAPEPFAGPMPVTFGDCAETSVAFVSGPRPSTVRIPSSTALSEIVPTDQALARQQAIDQARSAGILGTLGKGAPGHQPGISIGAPTTNGDLDKAIIRRYIKRHINKIQYCYEKVLLAKPKLAGTLSTSFFIKPDGTVDATKATGLDPDVASCVLGVIKEIEFPRPAGGGGVQVNYPFTFRSAGSDPGDVMAAAAAHADTAGFAPVTAPLDAGVAAVPTTLADASTPPPDSDPPPTADEPTVATSPSPLAPAMAELTTCFRASPRHAGVAVVDLAYDATGRVTNAATTGGVDDEATRACVAAAVKHVTRGASTRTAQRCPIAFGEQPLTALGAIDLDANGTRRVPAAGPAPVATPALAFHAPFVMRPADATPMKQVADAWTSTLAAGDDFALAVKDGAGWRTLAPLPLPLMPVPVGTGSKWNRIKPAPGPTDVDDESVTLSVYVTREHTWLGVSRVNDFMDLPRTSAGDLGDVLSKLTEQKASAFFSDRTDLEIAADDDIPFRDVAAVIDSATRAGFTDWQLTTPAQLGAKPSL